MKDIAFSSLVNANTAIRADNVATMQLTNISAIHCDIYSLYNVTDIESFQSDATIVTLSSFVIMSSFLNTQNVSLTNWMVTDTKTTFELVHCGTGVNLSMERAFIKNVFTKVTSGSVLMSADTGTFYNCHFENIQSFQRSFAITGDVIFNGVQFRSIRSVVLIVLDSDEYQNATFIDCEFDTCVVTDEIVGLPVEGNIQATGIQLRSCVGIGVFGSDNTNTHVTLNNIVVTDCALNRIAALLGQASLFVDTAVITGTRPHFQSPQTSTALFSLQARNARKCEMTLTNVVFNNITGLF